MKSMKLLNIFILICISTLITSCGSGYTPTLSPHMQNSKDISKQELEKALDYETIIGLTESKKQENNLVYKKTWLQPINKQEPCKLVAGESWVKKDTKVQPEYSDGLKVKWDGACKNGKAHGLGKATFITDIEESYEIGILKNGESEPPFYKKQGNFYQYGIYVRDTEGNIISHKQVNKGEDNKLYYLGNDNVKNAESKATIFRYYKNNTLKFSGVAGPKIVIFGVGEIYNNKQQKISTIYGYYNAKTGNLDGYAVLIDTNGKVFKSGYFKSGNLVRSLKIPNIFIEKAIEAADQGIKAAADAGYAAHTAEKMKNRYNSLHQVDEVANNEESKEKEEPSTITEGISVGTGFFVSDNGYLLTNHHVVKGANRVYVIFNGKKIPAYVVDKDPAHDIALLKAKVHIKGLNIATKMQKVGEDIIVIGYPNIVIQGNEVKATFGNINASSGIQGNRAYYQIDAPIQPGNSGSPVVNRYGNVIGIATASLNQEAALQTTGTLAQNVNYAIKISYAIPMLINNNVPYRTSNGDKKLSKPKLVDSTKSSVVMVVAQ